MNFFRNAKQMYDAGQALANTISDVRQQASVQTASVSKTDLPNPDLKKEPAKVIFIHTFRVYADEFRHKK
jgi:hypothetical protein